MFHSREVLALEAVVGGLLLLNREVKLTVGVERVFIRKEVTVGEGLIL